MHTCAYTHAITATHAHLSLYAHVHRGVRWIARLLGPAELPSIYVSDQPPLTFPFTGKYRHLKLKLARAPPIVSPLADARASSSPTAPPSASTALHTHADACNSVLVDVPTAAFIYQQIDSSSSFSSPSFSSSSEASAALLSPAFAALLARIAPYLTIEQVQYILRVCPAPHWRTDMQYEARERKGRDSKEAGMTQPSTGACEGKTDRHRQGDEQTAKQTKTRPLRQVCNPSSKHDPAPKPTAKTGDRGHGHDLHDRLVYILNLKRRTQEISEQYGGVSFLPQSHMIAFFLGTLHVYVCTYLSLALPLCELCCVCCVYLCTGCTEMPAQYTYRALTFQHALLTATLYTHLHMRMHIHRIIGTALNTSKRWKLKLPTEVAQAHTQAHTPIVYELGDSLLGPHEVAVFLTAGLASITRKAGVVQLNQYLLLELMMSQPGSFTKAVMYEISTGSSQVCMYHIYTQYWLAREHINWCTHSLRSLSSFARPLALTVTLFM